MALSLEPQGIDEKSWYYESKKGIDVLHQVFDADGDYLQTAHIEIPWKSLRRSIRRKDHKRIGKEK